MEKIVTVTVEGGVVQHVEVPEGVRVVVRDYDAEGVEADRVSVDEGGNECVEAVWECAARGQGELN
jgi:hypothetical protein